MNNDDKTLEIIDKVFPTNVDTMQEFEAQKQVRKFIKETFIDKTLNVSVFIKDPTKQHWKPKDHFTKIFNDEIKHIKEYYSVTKEEISFIYHLSPLLKWEINLLVDENDIPINQTRLAQLIEYDSKTVRKYIKSLTEKYIIYQIKVKNEIFYFLNPFIMFCGQNVNILIPQLFNEIGYISSGISNRYNRRIKRNKSKNS